MTATPTNAMPPIAYADINGIRMGYYDAGPTTDAPPMVLCHGWPELAYSWRHQIKALADAGIRVIAPDQRGYGATSKPDKVEDYDLAHLTGDLVALLDHLKIDKAIFVGHDWGGFVVWQMPLRHPDRVAGVVGVNTPHTARPPIDPIAIYRKQYGDSMYIVQFQAPGRAPEDAFEADIGKTFDFFMRKPMPKKIVASPREDAETAGVGASPKLNLAFPQIVAAYDPAKDPRPTIFDAADRKFFVDAYTKSGFSGGINWYRNLTRNWEQSADFDHVVRVPALMVMAENDAVLPPSAADKMHEVCTDLEKYLIHDSGHWPLQEQPEELSAKLIEWRKRRFG